MTERQGLYDDEERSKSIRESQSAQETAVGISTFASSGDLGFSCIFKQRYTDFQVNEILPSGKILHLSEIATPPPSKKRKLDAESTEDKQTHDATTNSRRDDDEKKQENGENKRLKAENGAESALETGSGHDGHIGSAVEESQMPTEPIIVELQDSDMDLLRELFGEAIAADMLKLYKAVLTHPKRKARDHANFKSEVIESKSVRTQAHLAVRRIFNAKLETATLQDEPGRMSIRAAPPIAPSNQLQNNAPAKEANGRPKGRALWDDLGGEYLHFTLYKENKDTMEVLYFLASQLKVKVNVFSFAGTKDRRGVTVQRVAAYRVTKERMLHLTRMARGWHIGDFEHKKHGLELGELSGNEFVITLRDCHVHDAATLTIEERLEKVDHVVRQAAAQLSTNGYINYYGLQRFGSFQTGTHIVGMKILQGDLKGAIDCILAYDEAVLSPGNLDDGDDNGAQQKIAQDDIDRAEAIRIWQTTQNVSKCRDKMPRRFQAESNIIQYLGRKADGHKQDKDWQGALMCIQRGLRLMYVHAYQSFVWNRAAVRRRELYGGRVVKGDLVVIGEKDADAAAAARKTKDRTDQDGEVVVHPSVDETNGPGDDFVRARSLSEEEANSGRWDIFDIVLPLPGWDVILPSNEVGRFYEEFMASDEGGRLDPHNMRRTWKDASLSGGYRKLMSRPLYGGKVEVRTQLYTGALQLADTDVDRLKSASGDSTASGSGQAEQGDQEPKVAVVLQMQLGSSQYATMALRELTKGGAIAFKPEFSSHR